MKLKQGDPSIYDLSPEEVLFFRPQPSSFQGSPSTLARPTFSGISLTHHGVAGSVVVWGEGTDTGVSRLEDVGCFDGYCEVAGGY